jgi:preprotein translocase subunit SecD
MIYLKRFIFTIAFLFLVVGYAAQNTMNSTSHAVNDKQQLIFQSVENKLILNKSDIETIQLLDEQKPSIEIQLTDAAAKKLYDFSIKNIGQRMQMVWNGIILSDVVIESALPGSMEISLDVDKSVTQEMVSNL